MFIENIESKKLKLCSLHGCNNKYFGREYCIKHYTRWKRYGDPLKLKIPEPIELDPLKRRCSIEGCNRKHKGLGYCRKHYTRYKRTGSLILKPREILQKPKCVIDDCNYPKARREYCVKHYERWRRHGDPIQVKQYQAKCKIEDCNGKHKGFGYCKLHYARLKNGTQLTQEKRIINPIRGCAILNCTRPHWGRYYCKIHYMKIFRKFKSRSKEDPKLEFIMNLARKRDNNTCQWYGCSKTAKETSIHVHHIFPQSEYPKLKYREDYMICYCKKHHKEWHTKRRDCCSSLL